MSGAFTEMPYDTKEHLISYHTEGQGEDRVREITQPLIQFSASFGYSSNTLYV